MPELPEVESALAVVRHGLHRTIAAVDDSDEFVCRPHAPGDIERVLKGGRLVAAHRRGKSMWCETVDSDGEPGPTLGIHLGMGGRIIVSGPGGTTSGGDPIRVSDKAIWNRFVLRFQDGGELRLFDKRRLGRVRLDPDVDALGPDAAEISRAEFRARVGRGTAPVKARLLDQAVLAGMGQPAGRRVAVAGVPRPDPPRRFAVDRGTGRPASRAAGRDPPGDAPRRRTHRRPHRAPSPRRALSPLRHRPAARDGRNPDDVVVPGRPALTYRRVEGSRCPCRRDLGLPPVLTGRSW